MATLTKADLITLLIERIGITRRDAMDLVDLFFEEIIQALDKGDTISLHQFGRFVLRRKKARPGRNPKTGEAKTISARTVVTFKPSDKLLLRINGEGTIKPDIKVNNER